MNSQQLENALRDLGLNENEAGVYRAALSLGPTSVLRLARATGIKRTTAYSVIESLKQRGLMMIEVKGFKKRFVAEHPAKLDGILTAQRAQLDQILPQLTALYNLRGEESTIRYYEGLVGVKSAYEGLLHDIGPNEDYLVISHGEDWLNLDRKFFEKFTERRAELSRKLQFRIRVLLQDSPSARNFFKAREKMYNFQVKFLPPGTTLTTSLAVIPKRLVIHQLTPPVMALVIENHSTIQLHRELFEIIWKSIA